MIKLCKVKCNFYATIFMNGVNTEMFGQEYDAAIVGTNVLIIYSDNDMVMTWSTDTAQVEIIKENSNISANQTIPSVRDLLGQDLQTLQFK